MDVKTLANELTKEYFNKNMMGVMGAKLSGNFIYVKGGDNGFPHTRAHVKVDLKTKQVVCHYGAWDCPVHVSDGVYE